MLTLNLLFVWVVSCLVEKGLVKTRQDESDQVSGAFLAFAPGCQIGKRIATDSKSDYDSGQVRCQLQNGQKGSSLHFFSS